MPAGTLGQSLDEELAHQGIEPDVLVLSLVDANLGRVLVVADGRVDLGAAGWQRRVAIDDRREAMGRHEPVQVARAP